MNPSSTKAASGRGPARSDESRGAALSRAELIEDLRQLIAALDRRVPHLDRAGEGDIARDAAALRTRAIERIDDLERAND